ncbi:hypothetical protein [Longispora albida]|uniref:hypothetical protein n=1 Tax=Longispora albida TaxID=203523 RepID=UPI00146B83BD
MPTTAHQDPAADAAPTRAKSSMPEPLTATVEPRRSPPPGSRPLSPSGTGSSWPGASGLVAVRTSPILVSSWRAALRMAPSSRPVDLIDRIVHQFDKNPGRHAHPG